MRGSPMVQSTRGNVRIDKDIEKIWDYEKCYQSNKTNILVERIFLEMRYRVNKDIEQVKEALP